VQEGSLFPSADIQSRDITRAHFFENQHARMARKPVCAHKRVQAVHFMLKSGGFAAFLTDLEVFAVKSRF
jgi:hypothetical protein